MRNHTGKRLRAGLTALVVVLSSAATSGQPLSPTIEQSSAILVFPKIIANAERDTFVQITNTSNFDDRLFCLYIDSRAGCIQTNFDLLLTPQQPTHWLASHGRSVDTGDPGCSPTNSNCDGSGQDPGLIPPVSPGFEGALICVEVDASGAPLSANAVLGRALLKDLVSGDVAAYDALGLAGLPANDGDRNLCIGAETTAHCPFGGEYIGCPSRWLVSQVVDGTRDTLIGPGSSIGTEITALPCAQNFLFASPSSVVLLVEVTDEFEQRISTSVGLSCWSGLSLSTLGLAALISTESARTEVAPAPASGGVFLLAEEIHDVSGVPLAASAVLQPHHEGALSSSPPIVLPPRSAR